MNNEEIKKIKCDECGELFNPEDLTEVDGRLVCNDCLEESGNYEFCENCDEWHHADDMIEIHRGGRRSIFVCESCAESAQRYFRCRECGDWFDAYYVEEYVVHGGESICETCYDDDYARCDECEEIFLAEDMIYDEDEEVYRCSECEQNRDRNARKIHDYGYKPLPKFKDVGLHDAKFYYDDMEIENLTLGVELEIDKGECANDCAGDLAEACVDIYCKHDGSLCDGIEIVSHPCTLEYHKSELGWDKIIEISKKYNFKSHDARTCGLHVHVGRRQLGSCTDERKKTIAKIIMLMYIHWHNMVKFSRRKEEQLNRWAARPKYDYSNNEEKAVKNALDTVRDGRYQAVNLRNSNTIEFRLFNGTLKQETLFATLEMVSNICEYAKAHSIAEVKESSIKDIVEYKHYDELTSYAAERELDVNIKEKLIDILGDAIGKKVRMKATDGVPYEMIGMIGEVVTTSCGDLGVDFRNDNDINTLTRAIRHLHWLDGVLSTSTGRWMAPWQVEFI